MMKGAYKLNTFIKRMNLIGIDIKLSGNIPWIYIDTINNKPITETFKAEHGFTIGWYPIKPDQEFKFTDTKEIFRLIRKYI